MDPTPLFGLLRDLMLPLHVIGGLAALFLFWVPAIAKKGGRWHRAAGRWYVYAMALVTLSGFGLALLFLTHERWQSGLFLLFLGVITGTSVWNGWRVLRAKRDPARYTGAAHVAVALANVGGGLALIAFGIAVQVPVFWAFGPVGLLIGGGMLNLVRRPPDDPQYWLYEHLTGMIGSGIASHTAFLVFGGRELLGLAPEGYSVVLWLAPTVVGTIAIIWASVWYHRRPLVSRTTEPRATAA